MTDSRPSGSTLSDGRYRTIVADPPWPINDFPEWADGKGTIPTPYPTMTLEEIEALPVGSYADTGAHLYLWTTNEFLVPAHAIAKRWGFAPSATLVWCKPPRGVGMGGIYASNVEFVLFCRRMGGPSVLAVTTYLADAAEKAGITRKQVDEFMGTSDMAGWWLSRLEHRCRIPTPDQYVRLKGFLGAGDDMDAAVLASREVQDGPTERCDTRWFVWPRGPHSKKPEAFLDLVERMSPGPYLELFARRNRLGWDTWGNESLEHVEMAS